MKQALLIGIDYFETKIATNYHTHDVKRLNRDLLIDYDKVEILTDDTSPNSLVYPSYKNIKFALENFYNEAKPGNHYLFMYCGCSRDKYDKIKDEGGERIDQRQRVRPAILPRGLHTEVIDCDSLRELLIDRLPEDCTLTVLISANYGHQLVPTRYNYNLKKGKYHADDMVESAIDRNVVVIAFSTDEFNPVEMKLSAPGQPDLMGSFGVFSFLGLELESKGFDGSIPLEGYSQALLKKMVASNPSKIKTYQLYSLGSEDDKARKDDFFAC